MTIGKEENGDIEVVHSNLSADALANGSHLPFKVLSDLMIELWGVGTAQSKI
jgi:hypothetical protein